VESVDDRIVGTDHDRETESVAKDLLFQQLEVLLEYVVRVVSVRLDQFTIHELEVLDRMK
jgi:hypothetical protein